MKKGLIFISFLIILSHFSQSFAQFVDVSGDNRFYPAVQKLLRAGVINLSADRKFNGEAAIDRYQLAYILNQILSFTGKGREIESRPLEKFYVDVPQNHYAYKAVANLVKLGIFQVPDSRKFSGTTSVRRYTFYSYYAAFLEHLEGRKLPQASPDAGYADVYLSSPYYIYIQKLIGAGLLSGKGNFNGEALVSRYEMAGFTATILEYYVPSIERTRRAERAAIETAYSDVPEEHYAREAVDELIEVGIISPRKAFHGETLINRYFLVELLTRIIEKIVTPDGELDLASPAQAYKDVPLSHPAYRSIQKMINLGVIPPGNNRELFYGERRITRYQMVYFVFQAVESVLSDVIAFPKAHSSLGYQDVPRDHYVYDTIQKLIWLGVLEGGAGRFFNGQEYVDRYELSFFTVNLFKAIILKLEEIQEAAYRRPPGYGFNTYITTGLSASQVKDGKGAGVDLIDLSANQGITISIDRRLSRMLSAFASFSSSYTFGDTTTVVTPVLDQAHVVFNDQPYLLQAGRTNLYLGFTPFGNSIFVDTTATDMILANYDHQFFNLYTVLGKLAYTGDIALDTKYGLLSLSPKFPAELNWLELRLGTNLITDLPEPGYTLTLPGSATQRYLGLKINIFNILELTAEQAGIEFSDPASAYPLVGSSDKDEAEASQYALTYFSEDNSYTVSLGYQKIGDDYYLGTLASPTAFLSTDQDTESYLIKTRFYPSPNETIGFDLASISRDNYNYKTVISAEYNTQVCELAYLNLTLSRSRDETSATPEQLNLASSVSISF